MPKIGLYGELPAVKGALALLTLLADKKERQKVLDVIAALEAERVRLNEVIERYGQALKIPGLLAQAEQAKTDAANAILDAKIEASKIRAETEEWAKAKQAKLLDREKAVDRKEATTDRREIELTNGMGARESEVGGREEKVADRERLAESRMDEGKELKARYDKLLADMKARAAAA